jgi:hypothetical protein
VNRVSGDTGHGVDDDETECDRIEGDALGRRVQVE